jgi:hypothetical protein
MVSCIPNTYLTFLSSGLNSHEIPLIFLRSKHPLNLFSPSHSRSSVPPSLPRPAIKPPTSAPPARQHQATKPTAVTGHSPSLRERASSERRTSARPWPGLLARPCFLERRSPWRLQSSPPRRWRSPATRTTSRTSASPTSTPVSSRPRPAPCRYISARHLDLFA